MSKIIEKVPTKHWEARYESTTCPECTSGWGILEEGKYGFKNEENRKYIGQKCSCGGTYELETGHYQYKDAGYVLVECDCGKQIKCSGFTTTCECGKDYNWNGTQLAPREQWEEDY